MELFITLTSLKGWVNQRTDSCCLSSRPGVRGLYSARPASKVLRWTLAGYSGLVVRRLSCSKYIIFPVKEALHIQMTPVEERFNRDGGLEVPGCWTAVMRRQGGRSNPHRPLTSNDVYPR